jgi:undecaprenyl-diphosphatase
MKGLASRLLLGLAGFVLVAWAAGELWLTIGSSSENDAMRSLAEGRVQPLIEVARVITWAGSAFVLIPLALICCLMLARAGLRREAIALAISLAGAILIYDLTKALTSRPRPPVEHLQTVTGSSFPSGHSAQAGAFWTSLALALRAADLPRPAVRLAGLLAGTLILAVAWSRVYLGVHYPSDVIAGVALGSGWSFYVTRCLARARLPRSAPGGP